VTTINENTKAPLKIVVPIVSAILAGGLWVNSKFDNLEREIGGLKGQMSETWTVSKAAETALRLAVANPDLQVPDPRDPTRMLVVAHHEPKPR